MRWSVVSELADAASGMLGAGGELDDVRRPVRRRGCLAQGGN